MIRAFALGLALGAVLTWWWARRPRRPFETWATDDPAYRAHRAADEEDIRAALGDPYLADLAAILERERW